MVKSAVTTVADRRQVNNRKRSQVDGLGLQWAQKASSAGRANCIAPALGRARPVETGRLGVGDESVRTRHDPGDRILGSGTSGKSGCHPTATARETMTQSDIPVDPGSVLAHLQLRRWRGITRR